MRGRQKWIITVSLLLFAMLFGWYFLVHVNDRKTMLREYGYRTLGRLAENLNAKINSYQNSINYYHNAGLKVERLNIEVQSAAVASQFADAEADTSIVSYIDDNLNQLVLREYKTGDKRVQKYSIPIAYLMQNLIDQNFFDEIFILSHYPNGNNNKKDKIVFQTSSPPLFIENEDSLFSNSFGFFKSEINSVELAGKEYNVFYYPAMLNSLEGESKIILAGLINQKKFAKKAYQVGTWLIILLSIFVLFIVVSLPLIKLMLMNEVERIYLSNVVLAITGIMLGSVTMILLILNLSNYYRTSVIVEDNLKMMSQEVIGKFETEKNSILKMLSNSGKYLDSIRSLEKRFDQFTLQDHNINLDSFKGTTTISINDIFNQKIAGLSINDDIYPYLDEMFWVDHSGLQKYQMSIYKNQKAGFDLTDRDYFSKIRDGEHWKLDKDHQFYLQSILSWSSGTNQAAISMPVANPNEEDLSIVAITTNLYSMIEVAMPLGYGFCLFDQNGKVLFHNKREKNLQQNLHDELKNSRNIMSMISGRQEDSFTTNYEDSEHQFYVRSLNHLPLYLATFYNLEYDKEKLNVVNFLTISACIIGTLFFWLLVTITSVINYRKSKIFSKLIHLNCLTPNYQNRTVYRKLFIFYSLMALVLFFLMLFSDSFLQKNYMDKVYGYFMIINLSYLVNSLLVQEDNYRIKNKRLFTGINLGIFVLLALQVENIFYPLILVIAFFLAYSLISKSKKPPREHVAYHPQYRKYLFAWLLNITIIPVCILFFSTFNYEERIWSMYKQLDYARQTHNHDRFVDHYYQDVDYIDSLTIHRKNEGLYYSLFDYADTICSHDFDSLSNQLDDAGSIINYLSIRPAFQPAVIANQNLLLHLANHKGFEPDTTYKWKFCNQDHQGIVSPHGLIKLRYRDYSAPEAAARIYTSAIPFFDISFALKEGMTREIVIILMLSFLALGFIYQEIKFAINKIFAFDFPLNTSRDNKRIRQEMTNPHHKIMIVSLPYSGLNKFLEDEYDSIDFLSINTESDYQDLLKKVRRGKKSRIWIKHFEYQYENLETNHRKLEVIEECTRNTGQSIIITSTIYPQQIIEFYDNLLENENDQAKILQLKSDRDRWSYLLYDFKKYNYSFHDFPKYAENRIELFIHNECSHGNFLKSLECQLMELYFNQIAVPKEDPRYEDIKEDIVTHLKNIANHYYSNLWYSCSKEERYLLYDLASDGFINSKNKESILNLIEKGLLKYQETILDLDHKFHGINDRLAIMNESFRYFILTSIKTKEVEKMEKEQEKLSNWGSIRTVLIIIVIGLTVFITFAQQNVLSSIQAIVAALGSILLVFTQLGNIFSFRFKSAKPTKPPGSGN